MTRSGTAAAVAGAAAKLLQSDGYHAVATNFRCVANALWTTDEAVRRIALAV